MTTLIELVSLGQIDAVKQAIQTLPDLDVNEIDEDGDCPVIMAAMRNNLSMLEVLITAGAHLNVENNHGDSPLSLAQACKNQKMINLIKTTLANASETSAITKLQPSR